MVMDAVGGRPQSTDMVRGNDVHVDIQTCDLDLAHLQRPLNSIRWIKQVHEQVHDNTSRPGGSRTISYRCRAKNLTLDDSLNKLYAEYGLYHANTFLCAEHVCGGRMVPPFLLFLAYAYRILGYEGK